MRKLLAVAVVAVTVLAGCGNDTCTSNPVNPRAGIALSCSIAPASNAMVQVALCGNCNDTSPGCQAEFRNGTLEIAPVAQQCQGNSECAAGGCTNETASCPVQWTQTPAPGDYPLVIVGDNNQLTNGTVTIGSGTTCSLL